MASEGSNKKVLQLQWKWCSFDDLNTRELYQLLKLRQDVFILEQQCLYPELDNEDFYHWHLLGYDKETLASYLRLIPPDFHPSGCVAIGRVVTAEDYRGQRLGYQLIERALEFCKKEYPDSVVFLSAQEHLQPFYRSFGFSAVSQVYLEDGIPHIDMKKIPQLI